MRKSPLKRHTPLRSSSSPQRTKKINKVNPERRSRMRKLHATQWHSPAEQAVRTEAFERAGHRCEHLVTVGEWEHRCRETEKLEAHHLRYPKTRELRASDLKILCKKHHELEEMTRYSYRHQAGRKVG